MAKTLLPATASVASSAVSDSSPCTAPLTQAGAVAGARVRLFRLYKQFRAAWDLRAQEAFEDAREGIALADSEPAQSTRIVSLHSYRVDYDVAPHSAIEVLS